MPKVRIRVAERYPYYSLEDTSELDEEVELDQQVINMMREAERLLNLIEKEIKKDKIV